MDPLVWQALRTLLALVFALALWHKLVDFRRFAATLRDYRLLPAALATPAAAVLAGAELVLVAALLATDSGTVAWGAAALLALYLGAIAINLARGRTAIDCGCFGPAGRGRHGLSRWLVVRNLVLIVAAVAVATVEPAARPLGAGDFAALGGAVVTALVLYLAADQLIANQSLVRNLLR